MQMTTGSWNYVDDALTLTATAEEKERYHKAVRSFGWVHTPEAVQGHAVAAWRQACRARTLRRLQSGR
jgi:hypothetical protein